MGIFEEILSRSHQRQPQQTFQDVGGMSQLMSASKHFTLAQTAGG